MISELPPISPPKSETAKFVAVHDTVVLAHRVVGRMISKTMAKRTANALNRHIPNREGV
jgi:hypothetical protein